MTIPGSPVAHEDAREPEDLALAVWSNASRTTAKTAVTRTDWTEDILLAAQADVMGIALKGSIHVDAGMEQAILVSTSDGRLDMLECRAAGSKEDL